MQLAIWTQEEREQLHQIVKTEVEALRQLLNLRDQQQKEGRGAITSP